MSTSSISKICLDCQVEKPIAEFYTKGKNRKGPQSRCKPCHKENSRLRQNQSKAYAVERGGGKCQRCGYNKCMAALEFHHLNPTEKEPTWNSLRAWSKARIDEALKKCLLLCANCHREIEN